MIYIIDTLAKDGYTGGWVQTFNHLPGLWQASYYGAAHTRHGGDVVAGMGDGHVQAFKKTPYILQMNKRMNAGILNVQFVADENFNIWRTGNGSSLSLFE